MTYLIKKKNLLKKKIIELFIVLNNKFIFRKKKKIITLYKELIKNINKEKFGSYKKKRSILQL